ncbi:hypothetical protein Tco_0560756 [Tanacetum coccineum]
MTPRSCLRWKPTGKIFKDVGLRWVPTGKIFTFSTTKVDSDPTNGSNEDITNQYECEQTLDVIAGTLNLSAGTSFNPKKEGLRVSYALSWKPCQGDSLNLPDHSESVVGSDNVVVKERTTPTTITEGSWGFEHTQVCFREEIISFVKVLKDLFNTINQYLVDELSEVQNVFHQTEQAVEQHRLEFKTFEYLQLETELQTNFIEKEIYDKLFKSFTTLEKHCISLEVDSQLNQENFQRDNSVSNQIAPSFDQLFELNELKGQSQEKDTVIKKLKERIKALSGIKNEDKIKQELEEIETINIELDHRVTKLIAENEHLKQTYKQLYDSIKPARIRSKEQCDDLINQVNLKSVEIFDQVNKLSFGLMTNPITASQPHVIIKKAVNSDSNGFSSTGVDITTKTRRP